MTLDEVKAAQNLFNEKIRNLSPDNTNELYDYSRLPDVIKLIDKVYFAMFGKKAAGCNRCYVNAIIEISSTKIDQKMENKLKCEYALLAGALLYDKQDPTNASKMCSNNSLTNELAEYHLATNPGVEKYFSSMPDDWRERVAKVREKLVKTEKQEPVNDERTIVHGVHVEKEKQVAEKQEPENDPEVKPKDPIPDPGKTNEPDIMELTKKELIAKAIGLGGVEKELLKMNKPQIIEFISEHNKKK